MKITPCVALFALTAVLIASTPRGHSAVIIDPVSAVASSTYPHAGLVADNTINGTGISDPTIIQTGDSIPGTFPSHVAIPGIGNTWHSDLGVFTPTITFDLGAAYNLEGIHLWNNNQNDGNLSYSNRGIQTADIFTSLNGISYSLLSGTPATYTQAPGADGYLGENYSISVANVRYVRFDITSNWGSTDATGISEIRFTGVAVPEPSQWVLLAIGGIALTAIRFRRRLA